MVGAAGPTRSAPVGPAPRPAYEGWAAAAVMISGEADYEGLVFRTYVACFSLDGCMSRVGIGEDSGQTPPLPPLPPLRSQQINRDEVFSLSTVATLFSGLGSIDLFLGCNAVAIRDASAHIAGGKLPSGFCYQKAPHPPSE